RAVLGYLAYPQYAKAMGTSANRRKRGCSSFYHRCTCGTKVFVAKEIREEAFMITDPFPQLTAFLGALLLYLIYLGVILSTISAVAAGILFLPIFGHNEQRTSIGSLALRLTAIGFIIIVLAIPARTALLHFFPLPTN